MAMKRHVIDMSEPGHDGEYLLGFATRICMDWKWDTDKIIKEMTAGDLVHLMTVFEKHFGRWVVLTNKPKRVVPKGVIVNPSVN